MYGTNDVKGDVGRPSFMAGITEGVVLEKVAFENSKPDGSGKDVLAFTFMSPNGGTFRKIFWEVDPARTIEMNQKYPRVHSRDNAKMGVKKGDPVTDDQAVMLAFDDFNRNIKHIMTKYMSEEDTIISNVSSYKDFAMAVVKKMTGKYENKPMRVKAIINKNNYLDFPRFGNYIESMDVEKTGLFIDLKYDNINRDTATEEKTVEAAFTDEVTNDLPF